MPFVHSGLCRWGGSRSQQRRTDSHHEWAFPVMAGAASGINLRPAPGAVMPAARRSEPQRAGH
jgi:hypothetical protein